MKRLKIGISILFSLVFMMSQAIAQTDTVKVKTTKKIVVIKKEKDNKGNIIVEEIVTEGENTNVIIKELKIKGNTIERKENKKTKIITIKDGKISGLPENLENGEVEILEFESWDDLPADIREKLEGLDIEIDGEESHIIKLGKGSNSFFSDDDIKINLKGNSFLFNSNDNFHFDGDEGDVEVFEWDGDGEMPEDMEKELRARGIDMSSFDGQSGVRIELKEKPSKVVLGVMIEGTEDENGVVVNEITKEGAADAAGLKSGDIIMAIDGKEVSTVKDLTTLLKAYNPEDEIKISYKREGKTNEAKAKLQERKDNMLMKNSNVWKDISSDGLFIVEDDDVEFVNENSAFLGVNYDSDYDDDENGLKIHGVVNNSPAEKAGLKKGDIITKMGDKTVTNFGDLVEVLEGYKPEDKVKMTYKRDGKEKKEEVVLGKYANSKLFREKHLDNDKQEKEIIIIREKNDK